MDLFSKTDIKNLLSAHQTLPSKALGQNFLLSKLAIAKIAEAARVGPDDFVLEIGPGLGVLTQELAKSAQKVLALEKSKKMVEILGETLDGFKNVEVLERDGLERDGLELPKKYKVAGNLPFYLTAPLIRSFLEADNPPEIMAFTVQKEMAKKICAKPPEMSILSVAVQIYSEAKTVFNIPRRMFWPEPNVDAAILRITPRAEEMLKKKDREQFFTIVKAGFSQPRKQLINNLSKKLEKNKETTKEWLEENGILPERRAETLELKDWLNLLKTYKID